MTNASNEQDSSSTPPMVGRALLRHVAGGPLLPDLLAERVAPQEGDERRAERDGEDHGEHTGGEHQLHGRSASTTASSPIERLPLTSTASPGSTSAGSASTASSDRGEPVAAVRLRERADRDHVIDAQRLQVPGEQAVVLLGAVADLGHVAQNGDGAAAVCDVGQVPGSSPHRGRVGVVAVGDQQAAARQLQRLAAPARELHRGRSPGSLAQRQTRGVVRRDGRCQVERVVMRGEVHRQCDGSTMEGDFRLSVGQ